MAWSSLMHHALSVLNLQVSEVPFCPDINPQPNRAGCIGAMLQVIDDQMLAVIAG